jgi:hypothetical protein
VAPRPPTGQGLRLLRSRLRRRRAAPGLATERGVPIVALYHTRKAEAADFVETVQGTFGTASAADTIVVVKRSRGQADATLYVTGRDVEERELALRFSPAAGTWALLGDATEYNLGETRRMIVEAVRAHGSLTPKQLTELTEIAYENARQTMRRMATDGQLVGDQGSYRLPPQAPVTAVTPSLDEVPGSDTVTGVTRLSREEEER